jgi:hypothetical protein
VTERADHLLVALHDALRPVRKCPPRQVVLSRETATRRFHAAVEYMVARGWTYRALARHCGCSVRHLIDCANGTRNVPGWLFDALPPEAREEAVRIEIEALRKVG